MFKAISQFFSNLFKSPALQAFEQWLAEVFTAEKALLIQSLKAFAVAAVTQAASTGLDNDAKRKQAFDSVVAQAQTAGVIYTASAIGLAIEMAVTALKNGQSNAK